jgi:2',3'-cyclic-nucleotide 2'-phosphodiesterase (5'-nucleotidase family)
LHDGAGLSDATSPNGAISNRIFEEVDYDLLTIGNHELYVTDIAYETFNQFAKVYGDRYVTSNVQILNNATRQFEYIGKPYRYFTTEHGLRIMAFGVLFNFGGNTNLTKVTKAADLVKQSWFLNAVNTTNPVDLFLVIGHNPARSTASTSTFGLIQSTIRKMRPNTPIQLFGGHNHIRDFQVYDSSSTALGSGRYCETLGWLSMSGINSPTYKGNMMPRGVPNPTRKAIKPATTASGSASMPSPTANSSSCLVYARRYLDWNRLTFAYHAAGSQDSTFDYGSGRRVTTEITAARKQLNLTALYGCAPQTYCFSCRPFGSNGSIFGLIPKALAATVINASRADIPRLIIINTGTIRFDLVQGPFTYDDSYIVSPFDDRFQFIPNVPYAQASQVLGILNNGPNQKRKRGLSTSDLGIVNPFFDGDDGCVNPPYLPGQSPKQDLRRRSVTRRQSAPLSPGYTTTDDFGSDGDDTPHSPIAFYPVANDVQANASFPTDGSLPKNVDLVFLDFIGKGYILPALKSVGASYTTADISYYMPPDFSTQDYLPEYAKKFWSKGPVCPVGEGAA